MHAETRQISIEKVKMDLLDHNRVFLYSHEKLGAVQKNLDTMFYSHLVDKFIFRKITHCNVGNDLSENKVYTRISDDCLQGLMEACSAIIMVLDQSYLREIEKVDEET